MKTIMVTETMGKQERFEENKHPDSQICDVIDINGTVIVEGEDSGESGWEKRHGEIEKQREAIRQRVRNTKIGNAVIRPAKPKPTISDTGEKQVAVYARVSTKSTDQTSSIENQTLYYQKKVQDTPNWNLHEIYSDEGKSGTSMQHREAFKRMIEDAASKQIDLILCASVSRFARNMSDCLTQVRQLKSMNPSHPVGVYFETENIYTLDPDSNQSLAIHAMLADWESANKSRRMILSYDQRICTGQYPIVDLLGYRHTKEGELIIQPEEAITVRFIFLAFIGGYDCNEIAAILTEHERPTLKGRTDWNAGMVRNIISNERRWGDLEARKTIVIDYVEHKSKKNEEDRISAYEVGHHQGIVSPEIAKAANMVASTRGKMETGIPDLKVIPKGSLKGFISVYPSWKGVSHKAFMDICQQAYDFEELKSLEQEVKLWMGEGQSKVFSMQLSGYYVPHGIYFLNRSMPSLTIGERGLKFNKACHWKLDDCRHIEVLYHPIIQTIIIRKSDGEDCNSVEWKHADGKYVTQVPATAFSEAIYENLHWKKGLSFRFRGITKERGTVKMIYFSLDEPQILVGKSYREKEIADGSEGEDTVRFIPYRETDEADTDCQLNEADCAYPAEWKKNRMGVNYFSRKKRDKMMDMVTERDILSRGMVVENPMIGKIPGRDEILKELDELLMSM